MRPGGGDQRLGLPRRKTHNAIFISNNHIAWRDHLATDTDRHIDLPGTFFVWPAMHVAPCRTRKAAVLKSGNNANGAIDDNARTAALLQIFLHDLADAGIADIASSIDDQYVTRFKHGHRLVDIQIVTRTRFDRNGGSNQLPGPVVTLESDNADLAVQIITQMRGDYLLQGSGNARFKYGAGRIDLDRKVLLCHRIYSLMPASCPVRLFS